MPIKVLERNVAAKIAAGEVVERPASVVKELVENSLDADSSQVSVETRGGGINLIRVTDNGTGIPSSELEIAFQRHATSKISNIDDLDSISSLGFRGEALPSIAAVAEIEIVTCAAGESSGSILTLKDGNTVILGSRGRSRGTTISVRNLFRSVPARLKFLKSTATENSHIANIISQYALAFPEIKFTLSIDGRVALKTSGSGRLIGSIAEVHSLEIARTMLEINNDQPTWRDEKEGTPLTVSGMVGAPSVSRSNRGYLSFFVNRRWVNNRMLAWATEEAYHGLLMQGKHPVAVINISLPTNEVDINIHPTKSEVKFQNERLVFGTLQKAVRQALIEQAPVAKIEEVATGYSAPSGTARMGQNQSLNFPLTDNDNLSSPALSLPQTPAFSLPALRVLGQLSENYIIAEGPNGLYLIDQHAAHERILFEKIKLQYSSRKIEVQGLLEPQTLEVSPKQDEILKTHYQELADFGFSIEPFGDRTYLVRTVPVMLNVGDWSAALRELLDSPPDDRNNWIEQTAVSVACHSAIRAGQVLNIDEMRELINQLEKAAISNTCPHGRPTMIQLSSQQLEKEFGRT